MTQAPAIGGVRDYFMALQDQICAAFEALDEKSLFIRNDLPGAHGALARPRVLEDGGHIEKAAVQFTHSVGQSLPPAATERNPQLAGKGFQAAAISLIVHPRNPFVPTTHMNLRFFLVEADRPVWYFGEDSTSRLVTASRKTVCTGIGRPKRRVTLLASTFTRN